jgi:hypothetical protein
MSKAISAAQGISLIGFNTNASPVATNRYLVYASGSGGDQITAAVTINRIPTKNPKKDASFTILLNGLAVRVNNHEDAARPPSIKMYGT